MRQDIPKTMRAIVLDEFAPTPGAVEGALRVADRPIPKPGRGEVLVRVAAAPCNPSDLSFIVGRYAIARTPPAVPGLECSGTVVASGGGVVGRLLLGRRVACSNTTERDGTWAEYVVAKTAMCVPLSAGVSFEQGASLIVNPLTAWALVDEALRGGHRAAVHLAAASQLGRMLHVIARERGLPIVHVVRRAEQVALLRGLGARHVLDSSDADHEEVLRAVAAELDATIAFDPVAGGRTGQLSRALPPGSRILVYGGLSQEACGDIAIESLVFRGLAIEGFWLTPWVKRSGLRRVMAANRFLQKRLADGRLKTEVHRAVGFGGMPAAVGAYLTAMTAGKVMLRPGQNS